MSIINEALKKTQDNLENLKEKTIAVTRDRIPLEQKTWQQPAAPQPSHAFTPTPPSLTPAPEAKRTPKRWYIIVLIEILVLCLVAWVLFVIQPKLFRFSGQVKTSSPAGKSLAKPIQPKPVPATQPVPAAGVFPEIRFPMGMSSQDNLVLNGIMMNRNKMVALINGEIYEKGDFVKGKMVSKITLDRVELTDGDEVTILSVRHQGK